MDIFSQKIIYYFINYFYNWLLILCIKILAINKYWQLIIKIIKKQCQKYINASKFIKTKIKKNKT